MSLHDLSPEKSFPVLTEEQQQAIAALYIVHTRNWPGYKWFVAVKNGVATIEYTNSQYQAKGTIEKTDITHWANRFLSEFSNFPFDWSMVEVIYK